ncbi:hypothetical protein [Magnetofaba australis]|uniref:Uncharacterized protein n=1 Tax=Magnetofaba australis IT-1 TaxID=1434232 RepID=A0A1Y2K5W1_9PROT|nr:hypothetical protein [Magnetofaba australis]OSM04373.1 hypothetical protein MAIT1_04274 [Magnetofaba australis IT-1]
MSLQFNDSCNKQLTAVGAPIHALAPEAMARGHRDALRDLRERAWSLILRDTRFSADQAALLDAENLHFGRDGFATVMLLEAGEVGAPRSYLPSQCLAPDAASAVERWMCAARIFTGALFREIDEHGRLGQRLGAMGALSQAGTAA